MKNNKQPYELMLKHTLSCDTYFDVESLVRLLLFMYIIMGARGIGKTTNCVGYALEQFKKFGEEFIYLRRYKTELAGAKDLLNFWIDDCKYTGDKNGGGMYMWEGNLIGRAIALSVAGNYKSGFDFSKTCTIIFDEAILMSGASQRYLQNEVTQLFEFMSTVFRNRTNVRVFILGNNLSFFNPYIVYFNVSIFKDKYIDNKKKLFIGYYKDSPKLRAIEEQTPLYNLTLGTAYHDYHYNNIVLANDIVSYTPKTNSDKIIARVVYNNYTLNLYVRSGKLLCEAVKKIIDDGITYKLVNNDKANWFYFDLFKRRWYNFVSMCYYDNKILYVNNDSYLLFVELLDLF